MLISCPECNRQISNKAIACPNCGLPIAKKKRVVKSTKRMRLPNGFGSISEVRDHYIRKPFYVRVMKEKRQNGKPVYQSLKPVAYFKTYNEAYAALVEYHKNPYELSDVTCNDLFNKWIENKSKEISQARIRALTSAWSYSSILWNYQITEIRSFHIKSLLEDESISNSKGITPTAGVRTMIKQIWDMLLDYAVEYGIVNINESRKIKLPKAIVKEATTVVKEHLIYTDEEMKILQENKDDRIVKMILIQCYSGWRPSELCGLLTENINFEEDTMIGGMKTDNGINRTVPIHPNIKQLVQDLYDPNNKTLCNLSYDAYRYRFTTTLKRLNLNPQHRLHDARKHFITLAKKYNLNEYAIKRIVGHSISDLTERVYTERSIDWLKSEISKIK